jgi:hypothetical protein
MAAEGYCPTCRDVFEVKENPPYGVIHVSGTEHYHPITRERLHVGGTPA